CGSTDPTNCPEKEGPDFDFGQPPILMTLAGGRRVLAIGQKSGVVFGLDPDDNGKVLWSTRVGRGGKVGGIQWGSASDGANTYVALSDITFKDNESLLGVVTEAARGRSRLEGAVGGGLFAIRLSDGKQIWTSRQVICGERPNCSPAQSAPV